MRTSAKHHAIDERRSTCLGPSFLCFHVSFPCLEKHVEMRACLQCLCKHGLNFHGGCRMWVLCFFGAAVVALQSDLRVEDIWDGAIRFDPSPCKLLLPTLLK